MSDKISVVIPTYNRLDQLAEVLDFIIANDAQGFDDIEIIVVDDGSPVSAEDLVAARSTRVPFRIHYVRQQNSGPSAARNNGLRRAANDIVLFVDDDVLLTKDGLRGHVAAHRDNPKSVVFGLYPYVKPAIETPSYRYLDKLESDARREVASLGEGKYIPANIVASGNLSVEKATFADRGGVYDETLKTPMAEEIELATRLAASGVPIIYVPSLDALHTQPTTIEGKCIQDLKYGLGIAEAYSRLRDKVPPEQFAYTLQINGPIRSEDPIKLKASKAVKSVLATPAIRRLLLKAVGILERIMPQNDRLLFPLYRKIVGIHYFAGIRDGLSKFQ